MSNSCKLRRILAAIDFSPHSTVVVERAGRLAKLAQCPLTLFHVITDPVGAMGHVPYEIRHEFFAGNYLRYCRELRRDSDERLSAMTATLRGEGIDAGWETALGEPLVEIIHVSERDGYDLLVAGSRGHSRLKTFFMGSTANRLTQHAPCPVWIVQQGVAPAGKCVLAAVDFSEVSGRALAYAGWLAEAGSAVLHVLHVMEPIPMLVQLSRDRAGQLINQARRRRAREEARERLEHFVRQHLPYGTFAVETIVSGDAGKEIRKAAKRLKTDVVVMGVTGRSGIRGLLIGNTADRVLRLSDCDVLAVKPEDFVSPIQSRRPTSTPETAAPDEAVELQHMARM